MKPAGASSAAHGPARSPGTTALFVGGALVLVWLTLDVLLLFFAGVLFAVFLRSLAARVERHTPLSRGWALAATCAALIALLAGSTTLLSQSLARQTTRLTEEMPRAVERARSALEGEPWGRWLLERAPSPQTVIAPREGLMSATTSVLSGTLGVVTTFAIILFLGMYLAAEPELYRDGAVRLVPRDRRARITAVLDEVGHTLRWWLAGKLFAMALIGVVTTIGLIVIGIQAPIALGLLAAILTFVPNFGPVLAAIPAVLLGLLSGPATALAVAALYTVLQVVESYVVTPLMQQRTVSLPPGLTIAAQVVLGVASGVLGLALATPLIAVTLVLTRRLYVEDVLGDHVE